MVFGKDGEPLYELEETLDSLEPRAENATLGVQLEAKYPLGGNVWQIVIGSFHQEIK